MAFDPKKHHRRSIRLEGYDYSLPGAYFVTTVCHSRKCLFGRVEDGRIILNACGEVAMDEWRRSAEIHDNMQFDAVIVMPNHLHGIVHIMRRGDRPVPPEGPGKHLLPAFMAGFKAAVTKRINELRRTPAAPVWQRNYYEHIIRDEESLNRIREYIINNPLQWDTDPENPSAGVNGVGNAQVPRRSCSKGDLV